MKGMFCFAEKHSENVSTKTVLSVPIARYSRLRNMVSEVRRVSGYGIIPVNTREPTVVTRSKMILLPSKPMALLIFASIVVAAIERRIGDAGTSVTRRNRRNVSLFVRLRTCEFTSLLIWYKVVWSNRNCRSGTRQVLIENVRLINSYEGSLLILNKTRGYDGSLCWDLRRLRPLFDYLGTRRQRGIRNVWLTNGWINGWKASDYRWHTVYMFIDGQLCCIPAVGALWSEPEGPVKAWCWCCCTMGGYTGYPG